MDLLEKSKEMVKNNIKETLDGDIIDIISYAVLALIITKEEIAIAKLPTILKELDIYAEHKKVIDIAHEKLSNYQEDSLINKCDACVTRALAFDDTNNTLISETRTLIISLDNSNKFDIITRIIHELIHLLRFNGIIRNDNNYKIKDGISISYYNVSTGNLKRKHYNMEEGIVQYYTNIAIRNLQLYLNDIRCNKEIAKEYLVGYSKYKFNEYLLQTSIINTLNQNKEFEKLIDESFIDDNIPPKAITYYNQILSSSFAFTELSKELDLISNMENQEDILIEFEKIRKLITQFLIASKIDSQKKKNK